MSVLSMSVPYRSRPDAARIWIRRHTWSSIALKVVSSRVGGQGDYTPNFPPAQVLKDVRTGGGKGERSEPDLALAPSEHTAKLK